MADLLENGLGGMGGGSDGGSGLVWGAGGGTQARLLGFRRSSLLVQPANLFLECRDLGVEVPGAFTDGI
jgi:hypothetical protein